MCMANIAVIIVNYGTVELTIEAVESLFEHTRDTHVIEIHIVDNASPGDDRARLSAVYADRRWQARGVHLWKEAENHGFGRANNLVLNSLSDRASPPEFVFFLNPDARLKNAALDILANAMEQMPKAAVVGAALEQTDGREVEAAFRFPGCASELSAGAAFKPIGRAMRRYHVALGIELGQRQVDWVSGAAFMARLKPLQDVNFFDPGFFLYYEEVDLMAKLSDQGWQCWHVPEARVVHIAGAATGVTSENREPGTLPQYWYESWRLYFTNRRGRFGALCVALVRTTGWVIDRVVSGIQRRAPQAPHRFGRDFYTYVLRPLVFGGA